jgi:hypothetical protein
MQIMPNTWAILRAGDGLGAKPYDPHDNILAGTAYPHELDDRYGVAGLLAAYNAGPAHYHEHLASEQPLPADTRLRRNARADDRRRAGWRYDVRHRHCPFLDRSTFLCCVSREQPDRRSAPVRSESDPLFDRSRRGRNDGPAIPSVRHWLISTTATSVVS